MRRYTDVLRQDGERGVSHVGWRPREDHRGRRAVAAAVPEGREAGFAHGRVPGEDAADRAVRPGGKP